MRKLFLSAMLCLALLFTSCNIFSFLGGGLPEGENLGYDYYAINMVTDFHPSENLPTSNGERARVILLLGQSNATGCSLTSYLQKGVSAEKYAELEAGYGNVLINYSLDNTKYSSGGEFVPVDLSCAAGEGYFGPEVGIAETLSAAFPDEKIFILKFTMSGYSLNYHWLYDGERASIYNACRAFVDTYMEQLILKGYDAKIEAVCWMQGESDTSEFKSARYYYNTDRFVSFIRSDFAEYAGDGGIYFIDAGISSSPYCLPSYPEINEAKEKFSRDSELNIYFSTIDAGLTTLYEPESAPDLGHYDALCELELGRMFGAELVKILN